MTNSELQEEVEKAAKGSVVVWVETFAAAFTGFEGLQLLPFGDLSELATLYHTSGAAAIAATSAVLGKVLYPRLKMVLAKWRKFVPPPTG